MATLFIWDATPPDLPPDGVRRFTTLSWGYVGAKLPCRTSLVVLVTIKIRSPTLASTQMLRSLIAPIHAWVDSRALLLQMRRAGLPIFHQTSDKALFTKVLHMWIAWAWFILWSCPVSGKGLYPSTADGHDFCDMCDLPGHATVAFPQNTEIGQKVFLKNSQEPPPEVHRASPRAKR